MPSHSDEPTVAPFDLDRLAFDKILVFEIVPRSGGGWEAVSAALERLLQRCSDLGTWWATIDLGDDGRTTAFAHLGPDEGDRIWTEVSADFHLPMEDWLTPLQRTALEARGWSLPLDEDGMQNFHRSYDAHELGAACAEVLGTLRDVYGFDERDQVRVIVEPFVMTSP